MDDFKLEDDMKVDCNDCCVGCFCQFFECDVDLQINFDDVDFDVDEGCLMCVGKVCCECEEEEFEEELDV